MYSIANYDALYRPYDRSGGELKKPDFVKLPINPKGNGLQKLLEYKRGLEVFAVWCLLLEKTTEEKEPENRGKILDHRGDSATISDIARSISLNKKESLIKYSLSVLIEMGWVLSSDTAEATSAELPPKVSEDKISKDKLKIKESDRLFALAQKIYPGTKRGSKVEFENFQKKHKNWQEILPLLEPAIAKQIETRKILKERDAFIPEWKHFKTWINNYGWEETARVPADDKACIDCNAPYDDGHKYTVDKKTNKNVYRCAACRGK